MSPSESDPSAVVPLDPCPFCGAADPFEPDGDDDAWAVMCLSCMSYGPLEDTPDEARAAWNRRR